MIRAYKLYQVAKVSLIWNQGRNWTDFRANNTIKNNLVLVGELPSLAFPNKAGAESGDFRDHVKITGLSC